ncbi:MAG: hypothetical protein MJZ91_05110 [Bacteroidales bacterium]|nr:hypothetical protein [Bacteroidales bacterium]
MRKLSIIALALVALFATSCRNVEKSKEYQALLAERDSLQVVAAAANGDFDSALRTINEIENALESVRAAEGIIMIENQEGDTNRAVAEINAIQQTLQENHQKIADLEKQLSSQGAKSKALTETINRLKEQLDAKDTYINSLKEELNLKDVQISELNEQVSGLNESIENLSSENENLNTLNSVQQQTINNQDAALNSVWYCIATPQVLMEKGLMTKGGIFQAKQLVDQAFDNSNFVKADRREISSIPLNTKKATILTKHPTNSYELVTDENGAQTLNITNKEAFWNQSNYLIISIK